MQCITKIGVNMENTKKYINYVSIGIAIIAMILMVVDSKYSILTKLISFIVLELIISVIGYIVVKQKEKEMEHDKSFKEGEYTVCNHCGTKNKKRQSYCTKCKSSIVIKVCPVCKEINAHNASYCIKCDSILQNTGRR